MKAALFRWRRFRHLDRSDACQRRSVVTSGDNIFDRIRIAGKHRLDPTVAQVPHPSVEPEGIRLTLRPAAIPHALYAPFDENMDGSLSQAGLLELQDNLVDGKACPGIGLYRGDHRIFFGAQHVLHLHRLDDAKLFAGLYFLADLDGDGYQQSWHR